MKKVFIVILSIMLIISLIPYQTYADEIVEDEDFEVVFSNEIDVSKIPKIDASSAIVMDMESGRVLYEKDAYTKRAMASTTKIMTALVAIENGNLNDTVEVSSKAASIWGSRIKLKAGQKIKLKELLYGLLLKSGNDAAIAVAEHIGGTEEKFLDMMNCKARELGAYNTCFKTPHGLDANGHYSTAYDMALITRYALQNPVFSKIVSTKSIALSIGNLQNTNEMLTSYPGADGVKTGYTSKAGRCLVTSATRNNRRLISVVLNCASRYKRALSSKLILDYAFNNYKTCRLIRKGEIVKSIPVIKGIEKYVLLETAEEIILPLTQNEIDKLETRVAAADSLQAPVFSNVEAGYVRFLLDGKEIARTPIKTCSDVRKKTVIDYLGDVFTSWIRMSHEGIFFEP